MRAHSRSDHDLAVIDVRRHDHAGGHVAGSFKRPAHTFYDELDVFHKEFSGYKMLAFYCSSSKGRAPKCAGWYQDYLERHTEASAGTAHMQPEVFVLEGGIWEWMKFKEEAGLVEYD